MTEASSFLQWITQRLAGDRDAFPWRQSLIIGAVIGGLAWGVFAALTVGAPGDQAHLNAIVWPRILGAAVISIAVVTVGISVLWLSGSSSRLERTARPMRITGSALVIATLSGWVVLALQILQGLVVGTL